MAKADIKIELLKWAINRSGRPFTNLSHAFPKLEKWLKGEDLPTFKQLENFADATYTPYGYFFLDSPPVEKLPIPYFRSIDAVPIGEPLSANLYDTVQTMQIRQSWMRDYLLDRGVAKLPFIQSVTVDQSDKKIAQHIRDTLKIKPLWAATQPTWTAALDFLRHLIEDMGVLVTFNGVVGNNTHRILDPQEFRGFVLVDEYAPVMFVNGSDGKAAQMFTLAHELAHLFLGSSAAFDLRRAMPADDVIEKKCDRVAAEFLVPEIEFKSIWNVDAELIDQTQHIARHFKVSEIVAARRALDLKFVNKTVFFEFYDQYMAAERRAKEDRTGGGNFYFNQRVRIGKRFAETVICAAKEGSILYSEAYRLTGLYGKTYKEFAQLIGCEA